LCLVGQDDDKSAKLKNVKAPHDTACYGTTVKFVDTPTEAAKIAAEQKKLALILHVAGYFEDPNFT
jgi:hypothetical protein